MRPAGTARTWTLHWRSRDLSVLLAAAGVWAFGAAWPDRLVALGLAMLLPRSGFGVLRNAARSTR